MSGGAPKAPAASPKAPPSRLRQALPHSVMLAAAVFLYWAATRIDAYTGGSGRIGPDAWPKAIIVFMGLLCAFEVARRLVGPQQRRAPAPAVFADTALEGEAAAAPARPRQLLGGIALIAGYAIVVPWVGFFVATALFLGAFPWVGGLRRPVLAGMLGIAGSFLLVVLFMRVAYISLPLGEGPFRALSLGLLKLIGVT